MHGPPGLRGGYVARRHLGERRVARQPLGLERGQRMPLPDGAGDAGGGACGDDAQVSVNLLARDAGLLEAERRDGQQTLHEFARPQLLGRGGNLPGPGQLGVETIPRRTIKIPFRERERKRRQEVAH